MVDFTEVFFRVIGIAWPIGRVSEDGGDLTLLAATVVTVLSGIVYLSKYWKFFLDEERLGMDKLIICLATLGPIGKNCLPQERSVPWQVLLSLGASWQRRWATAQ